MRRGNNEEFLSRCAKYAERKKWTHLLQAFKTALAKVQAATPAAAATAANADADATPAAPAPQQDAPAASKKRKKAAAAAVTSNGGEAAAAAAAGKKKSREAAAGSGGGAAEGSAVSAELQVAWRAFAAELAVAERAASVSEGGFAFSFVEGKLVAALRQGWWLLLDEINLVSPRACFRVLSLHMSHTGSALRTGGLVDGWARDWQVV